MSIKIRRATLHDLEEMQTLFVETIRSTCKSDYNQEQIKAWVSSVKNKERWKGFILNHYFLVAQTDDKIVGFGSLEKGNYLNFMYVHKDYLRQGIANEIYQKLKNESCRLGFDRMTSHVSKTARPFFERKGFKVLKDNVNIIKGVEIINFHMSQ